MDGLKKWHFIHGSTSSQVHIIETEKISEIQTGHCSKIRKNSKIWGKSHYEILSLCSLALVYSYTIIISRVFGKILELFWHKPIPIFASWHAWRGGQVAILFYGAILRNWIYLSVTVNVEAIIDPPRNLGWWIRTIGNARKTLVVAGIKRTPFHCLDFHG